MMVVGFSQELLEIIRRWTIRSKCDRNPRFFTRDGLEREGRLRKERDLTKMERRIDRECPKNSAEMLYSRCENFAEVARSISAHHHTMWHTFQN